MKAINGWTREKMKAQIRLKNNGKKSIDVDGRCLYRSGDGNACVAGCFIPDDNPLITDSELMLRYNTSPVSTIWSQIKDVAPLEVQHLRILQDIHDTFEEAGSPGSLHDRLFKWIDANVEDTE